MVRNRMVKRFANQIQAENDRFFKARSLLLLMRLTVEITKVKAEYMSTSQLK